MIKFKTLIICILIPIAIGFFGSFLGGINNFTNINQPSFVPPDWVFPVVWTILYILMGISSYLVFVSNSNKKKSALILYGVQLFINFIWTLFFFRLQLFEFSFILIIALILLVIAMSYKFYKINKWAGLIQIPYILWLLFASVITYVTAIIN